MNLNSYMPVNIISGKGCVRKNSKVFSAYGSRCIIITGGNSAKQCGALADVEAALKENGIEYSVFDGITQNPYTADCHKAGSLARERKADFIVGIGGGSPLDAAKAVAVFATNPELSHSDIYDMKHKNKPLRFILVGTTSGTGSEVTGVSVLTNSDNGMKKSIGGLYSEISFCDYSYTLSVPYNVTVSTAIDAFAHVVEGYFSSMSSLLSDIHAEKAFSMLKNGLKHFFDNGTLPDENMRQELYTASVVAGLALNITGACFPHTMGYVLTEDFGIPHGRACGAFLVDYIHMAAEHKPEKAEKMFEIMETSENELCDMIEKLSDIDISMTSEQIDGYVSRWVDPVKNFSRTPGNFTSDTARNLLEKYL